MSQIALLDGDSLAFPPVENALQHPNGLLAAGGELSPDRLIAAYQHGIFPWFEDGQPILWWSPDPRAVLFPDQLKLSKSLTKLLRQNRFEVFLDRDFERVIQSCSHPRDYTDGTWITSEMIGAYIDLHKLGVAHCISCYQDGELAGGLYGIGLGRLFFGESMFHTQRDASKVAFAHLVRFLKGNQCPLIDCQIGNPHLSSLGATEIPRRRFCQYLDQNAGISTPIAWQALTGQLPPW